MAKRSLSQMLNSGSVGDEHRPSPGQIRHNRALKKYRRAQTRAGSRWNSGGRGDGSSFYKRS